MTQTSAPTKGALYMRKSRAKKAAKTLQDQENLMAKRAKNREYTKTYREKKKKEKESTLRSDQPLVS